MNTLLTCQICADGQLSEHEGTIEINHNGKTATVANHYSLCDNCGIVSATPTQTKRNKRAVICARKKLNGLLTGQEVRKIRVEIMRLNQAKAARVFGGGQVAFSKYENNEVIQSEAMDKLLRIASEIPQALKSLKQMAGIEQASQSFTWSDNPSTSSTHKSHTSSERVPVRLPNDNPEGLWSEPEKAA